MTYRYRLKRKNRHIAQLNSEIMVVHVEVNMVIGDESLLGE
jgi:hypothetical protein